MSLDTSLSTTTMLLEEVLAGFGPQSCSYIFRYLESYLGYRDFGHIPEVLRSGG